MGSLSRKKTYRILWASLALIILAGLLSPPVFSTDGVEEQKLHRLEVLGLDVKDPTIQKAAGSAHALHSVDVFPKGDDINVVIKLSDLPSYKSSIYEDRRRLVVDLYNTINISPSAQFVLDDTDSITMVRNAQFKVSPSIISRVVLELAEEVTPEIAAEGSNLVISAPLVREMSSTEVPIEILQPAEQPVATASSMQEAGSTGEILAVPTIEVEAETPEIEIVNASAITEYEPQEVMAETGSATKEAAWTEAPEDATAEMEEAIESLIAESNEDQPVENESEQPLEEAEEVIIEIVEPVEEAQVEAEPTPEAVPEEGIEYMEAEEAATALNGMFSEMAEAVEEAEPVEPPAEDMGQLFGEMFAEMAAMVEAETPAEAVAEAPDTEISDADAAEETLVSLNFRDADLNAVLDIIARKGDLNIIAGKAVSGSVTVRLVDVPLDVALNAILNVNGYGYVQTENIVTILPLSEIGDVVNMTTETYKLSYAKAEEAKATLASFLTSHGSIEVDKRTNMLVVTDIPGNKERMERLIHEVDKRVQQVLIEVIILDSVLTDDADLGVSWGLLNTNDNSPNSKEAARLDEENPFPDQISVTLPTGADALNVVFGTMFDDLDLNIFIDAVVSDSDSRVLANPKILTLNNESAVIEIIQEFPYNDVTQTSSGGQLSNITFKEIGTKLEVKPQITHDEHVILWVAPEQNSIAGTTAIGVPVVDTRKAETTLIVKNHQTIVMGGLRENRNVNTLTKVPFFGDLPGVKYAFRSVQSDKTDSELLVFLTVHIVESPILLPEERIKAEELANMPRSPNSTIEFIRP
jgi:type IV pilus assembly protein PilQ